MNKDSQPSKSTSSDSKSPDGVKPVSRFRKWGKELLSVLTIISVVSFAMDYYYSSTMPSGAAPNISAVTIQGERVDVNALSQQGKPVVVYFWATWCGACKFVSPTINRFSKNNHVVTVALSSGNDARVASYLNAKEYDFAVVNDADGQISKQWGVRVTPTIAIIKDGQIKYISAGVTTPWGLWLRTIFA